MRKLKASWRSELVRSVWLSLSGIASVSLKSLSSSRTAFSETGARVAVCRWVRCSRLEPVRDANSCGLGRCWAAVSPSASDSCCKRAKFLQMMRRQANQMALAGDGNLQRLADPPGGISCQAGAVADIEAVNRLHQAADRFLQEVRIAEGVMAESFGDVRGQPDIRRGEPMLAVDVAIVNLADRFQLARLVVAIIADELSHRPRLKNRTMSTAISGK